MPCGENTSGTRIHNPMKISAIKKNCPMAALIREKMEMRTKTGIEIMIITAIIIAKRNNVCAYCVNKRFHSNFSGSGFELRESALKYTVPRKNPTINKMPKMAIPIRMDGVSKSKVFPRGEVIGDSRAIRLGTPMGIVRMVVNRLNCSSREFHNTFDAFTVSISS